MPNLKLLVHYVAYEKKSIIIHAKMSFFIYNDNADIIYFVPIMSSRDHK
jgi:hypothetical protein